jgi:hypothetical protein
MDSAGEAHPWQRVGFLASCGACMSDDFAMRLRLQKVAAYRELCRGVRRSGRENVAFACFMLLLAYLAWDNAIQNGQRLAAIIIMIVYGTLAGGELLVGLFKWLAPSAEGILLDGLVLLVFGIYNLGMEFFRFQNNIPLSPVYIFLGVFMFAGALGRFKTYGAFRKLFADRPTAEHIAWCDDLIHEILTADPQADELALDLPTGPHWKAKLLGRIVFFVARRGSSVWVAGPEDFEILREKADRGTGHRKALLSIHGVPYPEFQITDATWANYQKWRVANPLTPIAAEPEAP